MTLSAVHIKLIAPLIGEKMTVDVGWRHTERGKPKNSEEYLSHCLLVDDRTRKCSGIEIGSPLSLMQL
jgi:hypothetical protein